jgi:hypothetical protein
MQIRKYLSKLPFIIQLNTGDVIDRDETQAESSNFEGIRLLVTSSEMLNVVPVLLSEDAVVEREEGFALHWKNNKKTFHHLIKLALKQLNTQGRLYFFIGITLNEWKN